MSLSKGIGRYNPWHPEEMATRQVEPVYFNGDIPRMAGREPNQYRVVLAKKRPLMAEASNVVYTPLGMAWVKGTLQRKYSFQEVGPRHVLLQPFAASKRLSAATILQAQTPCTYGDWMSEHVASLARAKEIGIVEPLLLPGTWQRKPYVKRDLAALGIQSEPVDENIRIDRAVVINKTRAGHYWTVEEVEAVMREMKIYPQPVTKGSAVYLSRFGEKGEGPQRQINNDVTEAAMAAAGVRVVRTKDCDQEAFKALSIDAETVFFDHGSAGYNLMYWQTSRVVELFAPNYWESAFLFLADCLGIHDYSLWQIPPDASVAELTSRINRLRARTIQAGSFRAPSTTL